MIDRIGHINIRTPIVDETCNFYEQLMGLKRGEAQAQPGPGNVWLYADSGRAIVHVNGVTAQESVPEDSKSRVHHVAFDCRDYDGIVKRLKDMKLEYTQYSTAVDGLVLLVTQDPNGVVVELSCGVDLVIHPDKRSGRSMERSANTFQDAHLSTGG
jgi:catechol 2,3-dioxygenase-like lactoylglutathione lyase family enzyme